MDELEDLKEQLAAERRRLMPLLAGFGLFCVVFGIYAAVGLAFTGINGAVVLGGAALVFVGNIVLMIKTKPMQKLAKRIKELEGA